MSTLSCYTCIYDHRTARRKDPSHFTAFTIVASLLVLPILRFCGPTGFAFATQPVLQFSHFSALIGVTIYHAYQFCGPVGFHISTDLTILPFFTNFTISALVGFTTLSCLTNFWPYRFSHVYQFPHFGAMVGFGTLPIKSPICAPTCFTIFYKF